MKGKSSIEAQVEKLFKHTRQNSFGSRARYRGSARGFCKWVSQNFRLQNLRNLSDKHIVAYIQARQNEGIKPKTIKNDLAAIRFMHSQVQNPRYELSENKELREKFGLQLDKTPQVKGNRAWTNQEYQDFQQFCVQNGRQDIADIATLCRTMGLRITEATAVSRSQAEQALRREIYQVKNEAKGGKWRQVPLSQEAREVFERRIAETPRGGRLFIEKGEKTHQVRNKFEQFLNYHREKIETKEGRELRTWEKYGEIHQNEITWHGLRYNYVQERMEQELSKGIDVFQAAEMISREVGHNRTDVIDIYMGGN